MHEFTVGTGRAVKALFGQHDPAWLALEKEARLAQEGGQHLEIVKRDPRRIEPQGRGAVIPKTWLPEVLWIRMMREVPWEIAFPSRTFVDSFQNLQACKVVRPIRRRAKRPVMVERDKDWEVRMHTARG